MGLQVLTATGCRFAASRSRTLSLVKSTGRRSRSRSRIDDRHLRATFDSPRRAVEAVTRLRRELPGLTVELRPLGDVRDGNEPDRVAVDARVPWRWCRAAVMLLVAIDATARLDWADADEAHDDEARHKQSA
jgi:hypothetical protein